MNGMLIRETWIQINYFLTLPLSYHPIHGTMFSCGFWVTLLLLIFCTAGLFCFILAVRWNCKRERDDSEAFNVQVNLEKTSSIEEQAKQLHNRDDYFLVIESVSDHSSV